VVSLHPFVDTSIITEMNLRYPFPFWVVAEQKGSEVGRLLYHWPSLTWRNKISTQDLVPDIAYFCTERGC